MIPRARLALRRVGLEWWLPLLLVAFCSVGAVLVSGELERRDERRHMLQVQVTAEQVRNRLEAWIDDRMAVVERLGREWPNAFDGRPAQFRSEALRDIELFQGVLALNWIDADWVIRIIVPEEPNRPALGRDLHDHGSPGVTDAISRALATGRTAGTPVIELLQGGAGFATYRPVHAADGTLLGFVNGVFRIDMLVRQCLREQSLAESFRFQLSDPGGRLAYCSVEAPEGEPWRDRFDAPVRIVDRDWELVLAPREANRTAADGLGHDGRVAIGILTALGFGLLFHLLLRRNRLLRESEAKYRILVENQTDLVVKLDREGRLLFVSPSYLRRFGTTEDQLLGRNFLTLMHEADRGITASAMEDLEREPHTCHIEQRARTTDGWAWFGWAYTAIRNARGQVEAIVGLGRDITVRKELRDQLHESHRLEAVGLLAGGVAHDFNNILQSIFGHVELAQAALDPDSEVGQNVELIRGSAVRAAALTRQLLTFSRQQHLEPRELDLNATVEDTLRMIRRVIGEHIEITFDPAPDLAAIRADPQQLGRIVLNLCVNARDAMPNGGTITIETRNIGHPGKSAPNRWRQDGRFVRLSIIDTGVGMDRDVSAHVFEPFFTTKGLGRGTGLGLASVYGIVKQHGGLIELESAPGEGSRFDIVFEAGAEDMAAPDQKDLAQAGAAPRTEPAPHGGTETVLLAEDEPSVRRLAQRTLERAGYSVLAAGDGSEAVRVFEDHADEIDVAVLDVVMPALDGGEVLTHLRALRPSIRALFVSGYSPEEVEDRLGEGCRLLRKPYDQTEFLRALREVLDAPAPTAKR